MKALVFILFCAISFVACSIPQGTKFYVDPNSEALQKGNTALGDMPAGIWVTTEDTSVVQQAVSSAASQSTIPILVAYYIPDRDCTGGFSNGGTD